MKRCLFWAVVILIGSGLGACNTNDNGGEDTMADVDSGDRDITLEDSASEPSTGTTDSAVSEAETETEASGTDSAATGTDTATDPNPCEDVVCDSPPENSCVDDVHLKQHSPFGLCDQGKCIYPILSVLFELGLQELGFVFIAD